MNILLILTTTMLSYYYYNFQFFRFADSTFKHEKKNYIYPLTFFINYLLFYIVSVMTVHLAINWTAFLAMLLLQILIIYRCSLLNGFFMSLVCAIVGLASNIIFRCGMAIVINRPLSVFDNNVSDANNLKQYPLLFCFVVTGLFFKFIRSSRYGEKIKQLIRDKKSLGFYTIMLTLLYGFLVLNLLAYYTEGNNLFMKLWGIKSVMLVVFCLYVGYQYTLRLSQFNQCRDDYGSAQQELLKQKRAEERINLLAFRDPLTGCYNRQYAEELLHSFPEEALSYSVCFVDLDGLKLVNDRMGHPMGDKYLAKAAELIKVYFQEGTDTIIRFGGDEFLIIAQNSDLPDAVSRIVRVAADLIAAGNAERCLFSLSYGVADSRETENIQEAVALADNRMYEKKQGRKR